MQDVLHLLGSFWKSEKSEDFFDEEVSETMTSCWLNKKHLDNKSNYWLVVSTHLKNISQNGNLPQIGVKIKNI